MGTPEDSGLFDDGDDLRKKYAEMAPDFLAHALPGLDPAKVRFVKHHVAHAASAGLAAPQRQNSVLVLDGRGEAHSHLAGRYVDGQLEVLAGQALPHSLGLMYEELTDHLGFLRSSDEYKVMAMASYGKPRFVDELSELDPGHRRRRLPHRADRLHRVRAAAAARATAGPPTTPTWPPASSSASRRCWSTWPAGCTSRPASRLLTLAGGVALNCVANTRILARGPVRRGLGAAGRR